MATLKLIKKGDNETVLRFANGTEIFFSYETPVAGYNPKTGFFKTKEHYSVITSKHINKYLNGVNAKEISQQDIEKHIPC